MLLQHIAYFRAVAECGNMTRAAEKIHISQPALSVAISRLESELGVRLFDRAGNRMRLNDAGRLFFERTGEILLRLDDVQAEVAELGGAECRRVTVLTTSDHLCLPFMADFVRAHPELSVTQTMCLPEQAAALLAQGRADFALSEQPLRGDGLVWKPLAVRRRAVLLSARGPLAEKALDDPAALADAPFVLYSSAGTDDGAWLERALGFPPHVRFETNEFEAMVDLVSQGLGVSVLPEPDAARLCGNPSRDLVYAPLRAEGAAQTIGVSQRKGAFLSCPAAALLRLIGQTLGKS